MIKTFKIVSLLEGISNILLLLVAMPIKYNLGDPTYVKLLGMPHGVLFILYIVMAIFLKFKYKWSFINLIIICFLSLPPFGVFFVRRFMK